MLGRNISRFGLLLILPLLLPYPVFAYYTGSSSPSYSVDQVLFGEGSRSANYGSTNYEAQASTGDLGTGNHSSPDYQAYVGFNTTADPYLQMVVTATNLNLGTLSTSSTATATSTFYVRAWQAHGYVIVTAGNPPTNGSYYMNTPGVGTNASSATGTEQFGMNLVANTSPISFGAAASQTTSFSYGAAVAPYSTANKYAYNNGDTIAQSTQSTSSTIFTISYIFNVSSITYGGAYTFTQSIIATGTY